MHLSQLQEATATNNRASCNYTREPLRVHTRRQTLSMSKNCNVITRRGRARLNRYALPRKQWIGRFPVTLNCQHICQLLLRLRGHYVCLFIIIPRRRLHIHISRDRSMLEDFTFTERFSDRARMTISHYFTWVAVDEGLITIDSCQLLAGFKSTDSFFLSLGLSTELYGMTFSTVSRSDFDFNLVQRTVGRET